MTTKAERIHLSRVADLGCIICGAEAMIHHPRDGMGMGQRAPHCDAIPLCHNHHQGKEGFHTMGTRRWEKIYGTEAELLERVRQELGIKQGELAK